MVMSFAVCCARAPSGHAAAAPPSSVMELAPSHSINSSACYKKFVRYALARAPWGVLRLMTSSNFVANWHRKLSGLFAPENTIHVGRGAPVKGGDIHTVRGQAAARYVVTVRIHGGQAVLRRERSDQFAMDDGYWTR